MTAIAAEVAAELTRLWAENARLLRLLKLTPQQAAPAGFGPDSPGQRACELLGVATTILAICRFPDAPISPAPQPHALGSPVWR
jgi:hypothetical protein